MKHKPVMNTEGPTWYFTFGFGQPNQGCYHVIQNLSYDAARERMFELFGRKWSMQYSEKEWFEDGKSQAEIYNLRRIP